MREIEKIKLGNEEIDICIKLEDGEIDIDPNLDEKDENFLDTLELNFGEYDEQE